MGYPLIFPILIAAPVRDAESYLDITIEKMTSIAQMFNNNTFYKSRILLFESNSSDNTLNKMKEIQKENGFLENYSFGNINISERTERMAYIRNNMLDIIRKTYSFTDYPYVLFMDSDDICYDGVVDKVGIRSCFNKSIMNNNFDMICANQPDGYYDLWALRDSVYMPYDCWHEVWRATVNHTTGKDAIKKYIIDKMFCLPKHLPPIKVKSAFGGSAFISNRALHEKTLSFFGRDSSSNSNLPACEWVHFCTNLNVCINPGFVNYLGVHPHITAIKEMIN